MGLQNKNGFEEPTDVLINRQLANKTQMKPEVDRE